MKTSVKIKGNKADPLGPLSHIAWMLLSLFWKGLSSFGHLPWYIEVFLPAFTTKLLMSLESDFPASYLSPAMGPQLPFLLDFRGFFKQ